MAVSDERTLPATNCGSGLRLRAAAPGGHCPPSAAHEHETAMPGRQKPRVSSQYLDRMWLASEESRRVAPGLRGGHVERTALSVVARICKRREGTASPRWLAGVAGESARKVRRHQGYRRGIFPCSKGRQ